jgi:energy-coupling factor transport system permease protein
MKGRSGRVNNRFVINFVPGDTTMHRLAGGTKVILFLVYTVAIIATFDIRVILGLQILPLVAIVSMRPNYKPLIFVFLFSTFMVTIVGGVMIFFTVPEVGFTYVGHETIIWQYSERLYLSQEFLWYLFVYWMKRAASLVTVFAFMLSTTPSELAAGLNFIGLPYKVCTIVSLAYRTIPETARRFFAIRNSLQMRGVEMGPKVSLVNRIRQNVLLLIPLIFSSFDRVDSIANAMDLRGYGLKKKRTWYAEHELTPADRILRVFVILMGIGTAAYILFARILYPYPARMWAYFVPREAVVEVNPFEQGFILQWLFGLFGQ